ncbi:hypothetical protein [Pedobacter sp. SYSU D00535]|uniref:hypothetical protein n=1 Tax=Pedobacter sp. SYSU D00535 TaxID=2810308 RepID=UPI001A97B987|nr:hypothetical protein [Pedobacter sp. SYSU D00535]
MDIRYQYYNEVVLAFGDYETDFNEGVIIIYVPDDAKPFDVVVGKIEGQLQRIAQALDVRDKDVLIKVQRTNESREILLASE